jgi:hypothetical protein
MDCNKYHCIEGNKEEDVICALFVVVGAVGIPLDADNFLKIYIWLIQTLYAGINVDIKLHPQLDGSQLLMDAKEMKGRKGSLTLERETILKIANFISGNDKEFEKTLDIAISVWESNLLVHQFFPGSTVTSGI